MTGEFDMTQTVPYSVVKQIEDMEVRQYPAIVLATVEGHEDNDAFQHLFNYISGENKASEKISMTAPVISSEKIDMTAPVISDRGSFSFILPTRYTVETAPKPLNRHIKIQDMPPRLVATLRFRGKAGPRTVADEIDLLLKAIKRNGFIPVGQPFLMRYNSPFMPGFLRRNEVGVEVK